MKLSAVSLNPSLYLFAILQILLDIHAEQCQNGRFTVNSESLKFGHIPKISMRAFYFFPIKSFLMLMETFNINEIKAFHFCFVNSIVYDT